MKLAEHKIENPKISVLIPTYNNEKYLKESLSSVINQDFDLPYEIIIVNDGSTDSTKEIIESFNDDKIVYIEKTHTGISDSLNCGIKQSNGKYICRMDSDDIMLSDRLKYQYEYMEEHQDVDIMGSSLYHGKNDLTEVAVGNWECNGFQTLDLYKNGNHLAHPTSFMRKESIEKLPFLYDGFFNGCEDYRFWIHCISHGLKLISTGKPVIKYRLHDHNSSRYGKQSNINMIKNVINSREQQPNSNLTIIIPFKNEGIEIEKTVFNIRATSKDKVHIILINDASDDNYDYKWVSDFYDCQYVEHKKTIGVSPSRDEGVKLSPTDYFVLLDGHMRFYDFGWDTKISTHIENNPRSILSSETIIINKDENEVYTNERGENRFHNSGTYINIKEPGYEITSKWTHTDWEGFEDSNIIPTASLMGACYCSNKKWWNHIDGLHGLVEWGQDEPFISIKTWLAGGQILLMKDLYVGHLYRKNRTYSPNNSKIYLNNLFLLHMFSGENKKSWTTNLFHRIGENTSTKIVKMFEDSAESYYEIKKHFWENIAIHDMNWFYENINSKSEPKK